MVSIKDIAKLADVSVSTVSRVLNEQEHVSIEKRTRVLQAIKQTGYVPNRAARDMVSKRTTTIGVVMPETFNMFQRQLFSMVAHHLEQFSYYTSFYFSSTDLQGERACLNRLKADRLDGIILLHEIMIPEFQTYLEANAIPTVLATFSRKDWQATSITISEEDAALTAVNHLISLGHRKIGFIGGEKYGFASVRLEGYKRALKDAGIDFDEQLVVQAQTYTMEEGAVATRTLIDRATPFTALFAITDELALGAIRALADRGLSVPDDVSVVGFDDIELASYSVPRLTTIRQPIPEMGQMAVALLYSLLTGSSRTPLSISLPTTFIERESTARLV
ncbi:MAG: LacI family DNA-binding transcriptional regulator [Sphaerochaeta sp.]|jgi:LacI family transcriptional regulator|nr:LacI family DNA-binding transcriptional regulator [Sphaerochaeta sp.]